jgi:broad specificity phosphatase PhoE
MKFIIPLILSILVLIVCTINAQEKDITTVIIVRHAEKEAVPENSGKTSMMQHDVNLTEAGEQRAARLAQMLSKSEVTVVFSTNTIRTIETVNNYADQQGLQIIIYSDTESLADEIKSNYPGGKILVSAHSNTIGPLMTALGTDSFPQIDDDYYSGLFIVTIPESGKSSWLHLEY